MDSCQSPQSIRVGSEDVRRAMAQAEVVTRHNEVCRDLYLVLSGSLSSWRGELQMGALGPGNPFGEMSLYEAPALITVKADGPASILVFPLHDLQLLLKKDTAVAAKLSMNLLRRVYQRFGEIGVVVDRLRDAVERGQ